MVIDLPLEDTSSQIENPTSDRKCPTCGREHPPLSPALPDVPLMETGTICPRFLEWFEKQTRKNEMSRSDRIWQVPEKFAQASLENPRKHQEAAVEALRRWLDNVFSVERKTMSGAPNIILNGSSGWGKSHLAYAVVRETRDHNFAALFVPCDKALLALDNRINEADVAVENRRVLEEAPLIVLDDLGRERGTDWAVEQISGIVNCRYNATLPTIITTELSSKRLEERDYRFVAVVRRLMQRALCIVEMDGKGVVKSDPFLTKGDAEQ
jgi:DNA replication protein DnaC